MLAIEKSFDLPPDELGVKVGEHAAQLCGPVLADVSEELLESHSNGGTGGVTEAVAPALAGPGIYNDECILVASRGGAVTISDIHTDGVSGRGDLGLLTTAIAADVGHIANGDRMFSQMRDAAPLTSLGQDRPVTEGPVAKELVELIVGKALGGSARVRDVLSGDVTGRGRVVVLREGKETAGPAPGALERVPKTWCVGGRGALEGEGVGGAHETGGLEVWDAAWGGGFTGEDHVINVVDVEIEGGVPQDDFLVVGKEEGVGVDAAMHADGFETHGQPGEMKPAMFLHYFATKDKANSTLAGYWHGFAIGCSDEGVSHGSVGDKIREGRGHGVGGPRVNADAGLGGKGRGSGIRRSQEAEGKGLEAVTKGVGRDAGGLRGGMHWRRGSRGNTDRDMDWCW